jgi:hypothetical protein
MAARRLLIIMVVLLVISSVAAALVPPPTERSTTEDTEEREAARDREGEPSGELLRQTIEAEAARPERIAARVGDQLALTVNARAFRQVEIPSFGLLEPAEPGAPAHFDILLDRPGSFLVRLLESGRAIARIEARKPARISRSARSAGSRAKSPANREGRES